MHCEYLFVNDCCDGEAVEAICECFPQFDVIPALAFIIESVNAIDGCALVIASEDEEVLGILYFVR